VVEYRDPGPGHVLGVELRRQVYQLGVLIGLILHFGRWRQDLPQVVGGRVPCGVPEVCMACELR